MKKEDLESRTFPLLLRLHRLMDAFAKSNDEKEFYLDRIEGFILYVDLDKEQSDLDLLAIEMQDNPDRYCLIPKFTFFEAKKIMEGFVNEKVYDIDTKDKLLEIIQSKEPREHFLEFIYDHEHELEKWQLYYQERSRVKIIEWLRKEGFYFVFEEDLDLPSTLIEKLKVHLFDAKVPKDVAQARQALIAKAKIYYSNEALNPRPKRGRPPKQIAKVETETVASHDIYTKVPAAARRFLYLPEIQNVSSIIFSEKYESEEEFLAHMQGHDRLEHNQIKQLSEKFASLKNLSTRLLGVDSSLVGEQEDKESKPKKSKAK